MDRFPNKMNIVQLAETSGFSIFDISFYIQRELVNKPKNIFYFTSDHLNQLKQLKKALLKGYDFQATGRVKRFLGSYPISL